MINSISDHIKNIIMINGPLSIDKFIQIASSYYYSNSDSIGQYNDFITAPEVSQMFGEMIAVYLLEECNKKINGPFTLVELGPGNGTMMKDILRTMQIFKNVFKNIDEVALVETSYKLQQLQKNTLNQFDNVKINWYQDLDELEGENFIIVANEFFDSLPVKQYFLKNNNIYEIVVSLDKDNNFTFGFVDKICNFIDIQKFENNLIIELSEHRKNYIDKISNKITNYKGLAIIIDYGYLKPPNNSTLQAVRHHKKVKLFDNVGDSDITSLVNFASLQEDFKRNNIKSKVTSQANFLLKYGILKRGEMLVKFGAANESIDYQINKLISRDEMGDIFKVLITE